MTTRCASVLRALPRMRAAAFRYRSYVQCRNLTAAAAPLASEPSPPPPVAGPTNPKIGQIVDDISGLTLLQAADLVSLLKTRLNIQEIAMPASSGPVAAAAPVEAEAPVEEKPKEKTIFNVKLEAFETSAKPKIIREVKAMNPNLNLIEAKKFVESVPKILKEGLAKEDAEKMKAALEALGATVILE